MQGSGKKTGFHLGQRSKPGVALHGLSLQSALARSRTASLLLLTPENVSGSPGIILPLLFASRKSLTAANLLFIRC